MNSSQTITIPAAVNGQAGVAEYSGTGKVFACLTTTADFQVRFDHGGSEDASGGTVLGDSTGKSFRTIIFYNAGANAIDVSFTVSNNAVNPAIVNSIGNITVAAVKDASTYTVAFPAGKVSAGQTLTLMDVKGCGRIAHRS